MAKEEKKKEEKKSWFGGLFGKAESSANKRKQALQEAANYDDSDAAEGRRRPNQSRKWIEE